MTGILPSSDNLDSNNETELTPLAHGAFLSLFIRVKGPGFSSTSPLNAIDLYQHGGHLESHENKKLCCCPSSLALDERWDGKSLLLQHCMIKFYYAKSYP